MQITQIKFVTMEFTSTENRLGVQITVDNNGVLTNVNHKIITNNLNLSSFLTADALNALGNNLTTIVSTDSMDNFVQIFKGLLTKKIAAELGAEIAGENYVVPTTLKEDVVELQLLVADLVAEKLGV